MRYLVVLAVLSTQTLLSSDWSQTSLSLHYGSGYKDPSGTSKSQTIATFKHTSGWAYGDNFFFFNLNDVGADKTTIYGEFTPRLSSKKILDYTLDGLVSDILLVGGIDSASGFAQTVLYGLGLDLNVPGANYFTLNIVARKGKRVDTTYQATVAWMFSAPADFSFSGFLDYIGPTKHQKASLLTRPMLLWQANKELALGVEYHYWINKFGIDKLNESLPRLVVRWTF